MSKPLTPEEEDAVRRRNVLWAAGFEADEWSRQHPETQCHADADRDRLLATLDAERGTNAGRLAEARAQGQLHEALAGEGDIERALAAYRLDLAEKVRGLHTPHTHWPEVFCLIATCPHAVRRAVLRLIEETQP